MAIEQMDTMISQHVEPGCIPKRLFRLPLEQLWKPQSASFVFQADRSRELTARGRKILRLINTLHQARADGEPIKVTYLAMILSQEIKKYTGEVSDAYGREWGRWHLAVVLSMNWDAIGNFERAFRYDKCSLRLAITEDERIKSAVNCCFAACRLGKYTEAVLFGELAYALRPHADFVIINFAMALYGAGAKNLAERLVRRLAANKKSIAPGGVLHAHLRFEEEFRRMSDLPTVSRILRRAATKK